MAVNDSALSTIYFLGSSKNGKDFRWYRSTDTYRNLFNTWKMAGGFSNALKHLHKASGKDVPAATVTDKMVRGYLDLSGSVQISAAQRKLAQSLYEKDLFDWWMSVPGLSLPYKDGKGEKQVIKSGLIFTGGAVYKNDGSVLIDQVAPTILRRMRLTSAKGTTMVSFTLNAPAGATGAWWRETSWFKGLLDQTLTFGFLQTGKYWDKSWYRTFADLAKEPMTGYSAAFKAYARDVAEAGSKGDRGKLTVLLEKWLSGDPAIFKNSGAPPRQGFFIDDFINGKLNFKPGFVDTIQDNAVDPFRDRRPVWQTRNADGTAKQATDDTHTLIVIGDSLSTGDYGRSWADLLAEHLTPAQRELFRVLNYAVGGTRTDSLLMQVRALLDTLAAMKGAKTVAISAGVNDTITTNFDSGRDPDGRRFLTNTFANLRAIGMLLASRGISVIFFTSPGLPTAEFEAIVAEINAAFPKTHALFMDWRKIGNDASKGEKHDIVHRTTKGNNAVAKWLVSTPAFANIALPPKNASPGWKIATYKPDAAHWWRSNNWFVGQVFGTVGGWRSYWTNPDTGGKADKTYFEYVVGAVKAFNTNPSKANYERLAHLFEIWLDGTIRGTSAYHTVEYHFGTRLVFGPDKILSSKTGKAFDPPDEEGKKYSPLIRPGFVEKPKPGKPTPENALNPVKGYKPDAAHWWRESNWFFREVVQSGGWLNYWSNPDKGGKSDSAYSAKVAAAKKAWNANKTAATFNALAALYEQWASGKIHFHESDGNPAKYFGSPLTFGSKAVTNSTGKVKVAKGGFAILPPKSVPSTWKIATYKPDAAHWWRSNNWFVGQVFGTIGGWRSYWTNPDTGGKADKTYFEYVVGAVKAFNANPSKANYERLAHLFEIWLDGTIRGTSAYHTVEYHFGTRLVFGPDKILSSKTGKAFDPPDEEGKKYSPLIRPGFVEKPKPGKPTPENALNPVKGYKPDAAHWWRESNWFFHQVVLGGGWLNYWSNPDQGGKSDKAYSAKVAAAKKAWNANKTAATFNALAALYEQWATGKIHFHENLGNPAKYFGGPLTFGATTVKGSDGIVRVKKGSFNYNPAPDGTPKPNPKPPLENALNPVKGYKPDAAHWWRESNWFFHQVVLGGGWLNYWSNPDQGGKSDKAYSAKVAAAKKAWNANKTAATFNALAALYEQWATGKIHFHENLGNPAKYFGGPLTFGATTVKGSDGIVRVKKGSFNYNPAPDGTPKPNPKPPLENALNPVKGYKPDAAHWWRESNWFFHQVVLGGGWLNYWSNPDQGGKSDKAYSAKVAAAKKAWNANKTAATFNALAALYEQWATGKIHFHENLGNPAKYFGGPLTFGATTVKGSDGIVRVKKGSFNYNPAPDGTPKPNPKPPLENALNPVKGYKPDAAHWWRESNWFFHQVVLGGGWLNYWSNPDQGGKSDKAYSAKVAAAKKAWNANKTAATFNALAALYEQWATGKIHFHENLGNPAKYFGGPLTFGATTVKGSDGIVRVKKGSFNYNPAPDGTPKPNPKPPLENALNPVKGYKPDAAHWWRESNWFFHQVVLGGGWLNYWSNPDQGGKSDKAYSAKVAAAKKAWNANKTAATFNALAALYEQWATGKIHFHENLGNPAKYFGGPLTFGATTVKGSDGIVRVKKGSFNYNPAPDGTPPVIAPSSSTHYWWRGTAWFTGLIKAGQWRSYWTDKARGGKADADYYARVVAAISAYTKSNSAANFARVAELLELWLIGGVGDSAAERVELYNKGYHFVFGPTKVLLRRDGGADKLVVRNPSASDPDKVYSGEKTVVVVGDSLSDIQYYSKNAGVWTRLLEPKLKALQFSLYEAAVSGLTTRASPGRPENIMSNLLSALSKHKSPGVVVISGGVNNLQRGITLEQTRQDLFDMVRLSLLTGASVLLIGTYLPPNLRVNNKVSDVDKAYLKKLGLEPTAGKNWADMWSEGLQLIYDQIAQYMQQDYKFAYLRNYWDPIDGNNSLDTLKSNLLDNIHPKANVQEALFKPVWAKIQNLLKGIKDPQPPKFDDPVFVFDQTSYFAGEDAIIKTTLSQSTEARTLKVKFWAVIADKRSPDNNAVAGAQYAKTKGFSYSLDGGKTWIETSTTQLDGVTLKIPAGTKQILIKIKTFKKAPYDFRVYANIGDDTYFTTVDKDPVLAFVKDKGDSRDISIKDITQNTSASDCYFLAALQSVVAHDPESIRKMIRVTTKGNFVVTFADGSTFTVDKRDLTTDPWHYLMAGKGRSGEEQWVRILEAAFLQLLKKKPYSEGSPLDALKKLAKDDAIQFNGGDKGVDKIKKIVELNTSNAKKEHHYIVVGTNQTLDDEMGKLFRANHAYSLVGMEDGKYVLWDPLDGKKHLITSDQLKKISERFFVTGVDADPGDIGFDPIPQIYLRATFLTEHKIKSPESGNKYQNWINADEDGTSLTNMENMYKKYQADTSDWADPNNHTNPANYEDGVFFRILKKKAKDNDPYGYAKGATYFTFEVWEKKPSKRAGVEWDFERFMVNDFAVKKQVRVSTSSEITLGLEFRIFVDTDEKFGDQMKRTRAGIVGGATRNWESMTSWSKTSEFTQGAFRIRKRVSLAAEAIVYAAPLKGEGGYIFGVRPKIQLQIGKIANGKSWWFTVGAEMGIAVDLSNAESSLPLMLLAYANGDKAAGQKHLVGFLNKLVNANVYFGMNGLNQDLTKKAMYKLAFNLDSKKNQNEQRIWTEAASSQNISDEDIKHHLEQERQNSRLISQVFRAYGDFFHNYKWKFEFGALMLPFISVKSKPKGDGLYAGLSDQIYDHFQKILKWQDSLDAIVNSGNVDEIKKIIPPNAFVIIDAVGKSESFANAINDEIAKADQTSSSSGGNNKYRVILREMASPAKAVIMAGLMATITDGIMNKLLDTAEDMSEGKSSSFRMPKMISDTEMESFESYGKHLAGFAKELVGDALKSVFTNRDALTALLTYAAISVSAELIGKFLDDLEKKKFGDVVDLTNEQKKTVRQTVAAEEYKRFDIDERIAKDLAAGMSRDAIAKKYNLDETKIADLKKKLDQFNTSAAMREAGLDANAAIKLAKGQSFDNVSKDMDWNETEKANARQKINAAAQKHNGAIDGIADSAFRSGLTDDQKVAFDTLRKNDPSVSRSIARKLMLNPDDWEDITKNMSDAERDRLWKAVAKSADAHPDNKVLKNLDGKVGSWPSLTPDQTRLAKAIAGRLRTGDNPMSEADARKVATAMAKNQDIDWSDKNQVDNAIDNAKAFDKSLDKYKDKNIFDKAKGGALGALLDLIPFAMALGSGSTTAVAKATSNLFANGALLAFELAMGPVGWVFAIITTAMGFLEKPVDNLIKKNPLYLLIPAVALTYAFNKVFGAVTKVLSEIFKNVFNMFSKNRNVELPALTPAEVAFKAYKSVYDDAYANAANNKDNKDGVEGQKAAANSTVMMRMVIDGVVTPSSFAGALSEKNNFDSSKLVYDLNKIPVHALVDMIAYDILSSCFDIYKPFKSVGRNDPQNSKLEDKQNREIMRAVFDRLGSNSGAVNRDQTRFYSHWLSLEQGQGDLFESSAYPNEKSSSGYGFVGEGRSKARGPYANGTYVKPTEKLTKWLTELFETGILKFRKGTDQSNPNTYALKFGAPMDGSDLPKSMKSDDVSKIVNRRRAGMRTALMAYDKIWGDNNGLLSAKELAVAVNDMNPWRAREIDERWANFVLATVNPDYTSSKRAGLDWTATWDLVSSGAIYFDTKLSGMRLRPSNQQGFYNWSHTQLSDLIMQTWGRDVNGPQTGVISDRWLGDALYYMELMPEGSKGDDSKDLAKVLIRAISTNVDLSDTPYWVVNSLIYDNVIQRPTATTPFRLDLSNLSGDRLAGAVKTLGGSKDDIIGLDELLRSFKYFLPGDPVTYFNGKWEYDPDRPVWFQKAPSTRENPGDPKADLNGWIGRNFGGTLAFQGGGEWRFNNSRDLGNALKSAAFAPLLNATKRSATLQPYKPVVLDLDGDGLHFTSLADSAARYDVDGSGRKKSLAWVGPGDGLLAYDVDGDGKIDKSNEISFVGYKPGAKTDLEGLAAFDSNRNGKLDAGDAAWKKFTVWRDLDGDGVSDQGELLGLDEAGLTGIELESDKKVQRIGNVTLFGTTTFTWSDGSKGTVGDVAFDVNSQTLSDAEISRRRNALAQMMASGKPLAAPGVFSPSSAQESTPGSIYKSAGNR